MFLVRYVHSIFDQAPLAVPLLVLLVLPGILPDDAVPGLAAWRQALAAHTLAEVRLDTLADTLAEDRLEQQESGEEAGGRQEEEEEKQKEDMTEPIVKAVKRVQKIASTDKSAFKEILKAAVSKLLNNVGSKKASSENAVPNSSSSATYLDDLLKSLEKKKSTEKASPSPVSSLDALIQSLGRDRKPPSLQRQSAPQESFLDKLLRQTGRKGSGRQKPSHLDRLIASLEDSREDSDEDFSQGLFRRRKERTQLDRLLASFQEPQDDEDFSDIFLERPRSLSFEDGFQFRRTEGLRSALKSSKRLDEDLDYFLRKLERQRD